MRTCTHPLPHGTPGTASHITTLHFGADDAPHKVYMQASLHADELPGSLVLHHLAQRLSALEAQDAVRARIVLAPLCNPLGLGQQLLYAHTGRFDWATGRNFNRLPDMALYDWTLERLRSTGFAPDAAADAQAAICAVRQAMREALAAFVPRTSVQALHQRLLLLACDADLVLDLHCDQQAILHLYTQPQHWAAIEPLARHLGTRCHIVGEDSLAHSFDEVLSGAWLRLQAQWPDAPLAQACTSATVELRGQNDLCHATAQRDAGALLQYLHLRGHVQLQAQELRPAPPLLAPPVPLGGLCYIAPPQSGIVVWHVQVGQSVRAQDKLADVTDPLSGRCLSVYSPVDGCVFARLGRNWVQMHDTLLSLGGKLDTGHRGLTP